MERSEAVHGGLWWRASAYEVREGSVRVTPDARVEPYDPLADESGQAAYLAFSHLAEAPEETILAWCRSHGIPGALPHATRRVCLAPQWFPATRGEDPPEPIDVAGQEVWERVGGEFVAWRSLSDRVVAPAGSHPPRSPVADAEYRELYERYSDDEDEEDAARELDLTAAAVGLGWEFLKPGVERLQTLSGTMIREDLDAGWAPYFPEIARADPAGANYPRPLTEPFWRAYAEPVDEIRGNAQLLASILANVAAFRGSAEEPTAAGHSLPDLAILHRLAEPVSPTLIPTSGGYLQGWRSPSMLAYLAYLAIQDLSGRRRLRICQVSDCRKLFLSEAHQATYCSRKCRVVGQQRTYRQNHPPVRRPRTAAKERSEGTIG